MYFLEANTAMVAAKLHNLTALNIGQTKDLKMIEIKLNQAEVASLNRIADLKVRHEVQKVMLEAKREALGFRMKATEKGGLSVYTGGKYPVTQYKSQWLAILDNAEAIRAEVNKLPERKITE